MREQEKMPDGTKNLQKNENANAWNSGRNVKENGQKRKLPARKNEETNM